MILDAELLSWIGRKLTRGEKTLFALFVVLSLLAAAAEAMGVALMAQVLGMLSDGDGFDQIPVLGSVGRMFRGSEPGAALQMIAVLLGVAVVLRGALDYAYHVLSAVFPLRVAKRLNVEAYGNMQNAVLPFVQEQPYGKLQNAVLGCPEQVARAVQGVAQLMSEIILLAVYVGLAALISLKLTILIGALFVVFFWLRKVTIDKAVEHAAGNQLQAATVLFGVLQESVGGATVIRLATAEDRMMHKYGEAAEEMRRTQVRQQLYKAITGPAMVVVTGFVICASLLAVGMFAGQALNQWIAQFLLYVAVLFRLLRPVSGVNRCIAEIASYLPAFRKLMAFEQEAVRRKQRTGTRVFDQLKVGIDVDSLHFKGFADQGFSLEDVSFKIPKGAMVAIVGPSGAGKSTIVSLIARLQEPPAGAIHVDGVDLLDLDVRTWRRRISLVSQETFLFNETVMENIRFGTEASDEQVMKAAQFAAADEFIRAMPTGYETVLGDRGYRLSGGQRQRIAIARAIVSDPDLLILDEATSQLDSVTENAIQRAVDYLARDRTVLVIAHRLSTVQRADELVVLDRGRVVELGRHEDLRACNGVYAEMLKHQDLGVLKDAVS